MEYTTHHIATYSANFTSSNAYYYYYYYQKKAPTLTFYRFIAKFGHSNIQVSNKKEGRILGKLLLLLRQQGEDDGSCSDTVLSYIPKTHHTKTHKNTHSK